MMKSIGLCLIVKNESHVIRRCLDSAKSIIDYVLVVDTGSDDDTIDVINNWLLENNFKGNVISEPWKNFAYNRTFALSKLREIDWIDYALMIDADETLFFEESFDIAEFKTNLTLDVYNITTNIWGNRYHRPQLSTNKKVCEYVGVVHEFLSLSYLSVGNLVGIENRPVQDSARNKGGNKFLKDIELLEEGISNESDGSWLKSRYTFYLAQSYKDSGNSEKALENYLKRADMGFWEEEVYVSLYQSGNLMKDLGYPKEQVLQTYMRAVEVNPRRAEALYGFIFYCRINAFHQQGYIVGKHAINITMPDSALFTESWIYEYGMLDEFSIIAFWSGNFQDSKLACEKILSNPSTPEHYIGRIKQNLQYAIDRLG